MDPVHIPQYPIWRSYKVLRGPLDGIEERKVTTMTTVPPSSPESRHVRAHAARVATPRACGCGQPVAYDLNKHEFFCIGCGASKLCLCIRSPFSSGVRPVQVA